MLGLGECTSNFSADAMVGRNSLGVSLVPRNGNGWPTARRPGHYAIDSSILVKASSSKHFPITVRKQF